MAEAKKRKKFTDSRTENTLRGSKGISAESRLAKRAKKDELKEEQKRVKLLNENVKMGEEVMTYINNLKTAEETLTCSNVPIDNEYWEINASVFQEKLKVFLRLWYFPHGGGKLSRTKPEQLEALKHFNLTKEGIDCRIQECLVKVEEWKKELEEIRADQFDEEQEFDDSRNEE